MILKKMSEKINHHGKRADAIVKGMMQHSRATTGQKELTDINALRMNILRLCYHGIRAKDKDLNATIKTDFDKTHWQNKYHSAGYWKSVLNLFNNAFYAVNEKKKIADENYQATCFSSNKKNK